MIKTIPSLLSAASGSKGLLPNPHAARHCAVSGPSLGSKQHLGSRPRETQVCSAKAKGQSKSNENGAATSGLKEGYDVYVNEPQPLDEGEEKHILSVFVADEAGLINRVAGVFARRGANIESLAVGLNVDKALFTIVMNGTAATVANLVKQISKLVKVKFVEDITNFKRIERELVLIKLMAPPGPTRTEVMQLVQIFRASVVDVSERCITLSVTGDAGKIVAMQRTLGKFGILELARTGKISLKRGEQLLEMGGWGDGMAKRLRQEREQFKVPQGSAVESSEEEDGDVYAVDDDGSPGVWDILDASYNHDGSVYEAHTLSIEVQDTPGVLNQVTGVFARRGYNVQSLAVGNSERDGMSRITMTIPGTGKDIQNLIKQINKLVYVHKVTDLTDVPFVTRELMLIKVRCSASQRGELRALAEMFHGQSSDVSLNTITLQVQGKEDKMAALQELLAPYGILEIARTGRVALERDSGVNTRYLSKMKGNQVMV